VQEHEPEVARRTRWLAAPKDYVLHQLVGRLVTDSTLASRTDLDPTLLPDVVAPRTIVGEFHAMPVVAGAGDRACEVLAVGAHSLAPMVSWGTTANCSVPLDSAVPAGWRASLTVDGRQLMEAGLSAAGSALGWIAKLTGVPTAELSKQAQHSPPGARGVIVLPWLGGARAPWWRSDARERILGRTSETTAGDLARAVYEGVAHDIRRALAVLPEAPRLLSLAGGGSDDQVWQRVLTGVTGLPVAVTVGADAAAIGAARLAAREQIADAHVPVEPLLLPDDQQVRIYGELCQQHDAAARAALESLA
jgi:xylulokinase